MSSALATRHLVLRPGMPVLARSVGVLQVGLDAPTVLLSDEPGVRQLLDALGRPGGVLPGDELVPSAAAALRALLDAGLVLDVGSGPAADAPLVALRAQFGPDAVRRQAARVAATVAVRADPAAWPPLDAALSAAGLRVATGQDEPAVHLVVAAGPVARESVDPLTRASLPHLVVSGAATGRRVGPFVEPGRTACLRCVDAHESLADPRRPLLLAQSAALAAERPPPCDPVLDQMAFAWAARDLARYLEGDEPATWSATADIGPASGPVLTPWGRHPYCGCSWDALIELP
ncbi:MAG TPA: hypothetical protein VNS81_08630 [Nocardioides sp.]|nr:hypothetical protein [Nocardioides sp.]